MGSATAVDTTYSLTLSVSTLGGTWTGTPTVDAANILTALTSVSPDIGLVIGPASCTDGTFASCHFPITIPDATASGTYNIYISAGAFTDGTSTSEFAEVDGLEFVMIVSGTATSAVTSTSTAASTLSQTSTPAVTSTPTAVVTSSSTSTAAATSSSTSTAALTSSRTSTAAVTGSSTSTAAQTGTPTSTNTGTPAMTKTQTGTSAVTFTATSTNTATNSQTTTQTSSPTKTSATLVLSFAMSSAGTTNASTTILGPGASVYVCATRDYGIWGVPSLNAASVTVQNGAGTVVSAAGIGVTISGGVGTVTGAIACWSITLAAGGVAGQYSFSFAPGAIVETGYSSGAGTIPMPGLQIGYSVAATIVRRTSASPNMWSAALTGLPIDPSDADIYIKLSLTGGLSAFTTCPTATAASFTFRVGDAGATQAVTLGSTICSIGSAFVYVPIAFSGSVSAAGAWSLQLTPGALCSSTGSTLCNYGAAGVITAASMSLVLGYTSNVSVVNAAGIALSTTHISPGVAGAYFLRIALSGASAPTAAFVAAPIVMSSYLAVTYGGQPTVAISVGAVIARMGIAYVDFALTVNAAAPAGVYTFTVTQPGLLTYANLSTGPIMVSTAVSPANDNPGVRLQTVAIGFSVDLISIGDASYGGQAINIFSGSDVAAYIRLTRTTGAMGVPIFSNAITGASLSMISVKHNGVSDIVHNYYFTFNADNFTLTSSFVDLEVVIPVVVHGAAAGTYTITFAEGVFSVGGINSAASVAAGSILVPYTLASGTPALTDGSGIDVTSTWFGPVTSGLFLRIEAAQVGAGSAAAIASNGTNSTVTVDTTKIIFYPATTSVTPAIGFGFTNAINYVAGAAYVDVGLDTSNVTPGMYDVWLADGAITDYYGVSSQATTTAIAMVKVGFGIRAEYWKTSIAGAPLLQVKSDEWLSPAGVYIVIIRPDARALESSIRLNNVASNVPTSISTGVWPTPGILNTSYGLPLSAVGDSYGRAECNYVIGGGLTPGTYSAAAVAAQSLLDASGTISNYAYTLPTIKIGFALTASLRKSTNITFNYAGTYTPYLTSLLSMPAPINEHASLQLVLSTVTAPLVTAAATTAIFSRFPLATTQISSTGTVNQLKFAIPDVATTASVAPGKYNILLTSGVLIDNQGNFNAELQLSVIIGMPAVLYDAQGANPATLRSSNQSVSVYVTAGRSVLLRQYEGGANSISSTANFSALYHTVLLNGDSKIDVTNIVGGMRSVYVSHSTTLPYYSQYALDLTGISSGTDYYTLPRALTASGVPMMMLTDENAAAEWSWPSIAIIVDRVAPIGIPQASSATPYIGSTATIILPVTLFRDSITPAGSITIITVTASDMHGFMLTPGVQGIAALTAASVLGPESNVIFTVTAQDEAGNMAATQFTVTIYALRKPALSVADARLVYTATTLTTGKSQFASSSLMLKLIATFPEAVNGVVQSDLSVLAMDNGAQLVNITYTVGTPISSANGRVWGYTVTIAAASATDGRKIEFRLFSLGARTTAASLLTSASTSVFAVIDNYAPSASVITSSFTAVVGIPFFAVVPVTMHTDIVPYANPYVTAADNIDIVSGLLNVNVNLALTAGKAGAAYVSGTATSVPVNGAVLFTITARDLAGNIVSSGTFRVPVISQIGV